MTRFLSASLGAEEPFFRRGLLRLESANGHPKTDIRFSTEVLHASQQKMLELGLDPKDTTPQELYNVLQSRIAADDARLTRSLQTRAATHISAEAQVLAGMLHALRELPDTKRCFAIKPSVVKSLLKKQPPKKTMKKLGYRSVDSMLKHETATDIVAAAVICEDTHYMQRFHEQYKKLLPSDFENRSISITQLDFKKWETLADDVVAFKKHNILSFKELGALVFLPFPKDIPAGAVTVSLSLALHELNEIRASSTFLKLCQVRHDFGNVVRSVADGQVSLDSQVLDQPVPWHLVQRYYARLTNHFREEIFEPHVQREDMAWQAIEQTLSTIEPSLAFWHGSGHIGVLHEHKPLSMNIVDVALNFCNNLPYERRIVRYFQESIRHELLLRYLHYESVEQSVLRSLQPKLAAEMAMA